MLDHGLRRRAEERPIAAYFLSETRTVEVLMLAAERC